MSDAPFEIDLKFLPDWLKESADSDRYSQFEGDSGERRGKPFRRDSGPRGRQPSDQRAGRGPRPDRPSGDRARSQHGPRKGQARPADREVRSAPPQAPPARQKIQLKIEILPEPAGVQGVIRQIKSGNRAYPFFGTARLFLEKPERYRVRITSPDSTAPIYQVGETLVGFDRVLLSKIAFEQLKSEYYAESIVEGDPIKGSFKNVARCRSTGTVLGPTSFHGYQPALRKLYEERFSRRMSFRDFQSEEIETLNSEQAVNEWKEQARRSVSYSTLKEAEPRTFKTPAEMEEHFRSHYLPGLLNSGACIEVNGSVARNSPDREILGHLRDAWERERNFPAALIYHLRPRLLEAGLQIFKHRKRVFFVSPIRPQRHAQGQVFSDGISAILALLEKHPRLNRPQLASHLLGSNAPAEAPETVARKEALASDLHYLIHAGHVIEFHDGTLDLPLSPKAEHSQETGNLEVSPEMETLADSDPVAELNSGTGHGVISEQVSVQEQELEIASDSAAESKELPSETAATLLAPSELAQPEIPASETSLIDSSATVVPE